MSRRYNLGTVAEYQFFNGSGNPTPANVCHPRAVSLPTAADSDRILQPLRQRRFTRHADPSVGPADFTSNTTINGITLGEWHVDVTGLPSGTLYFIYGTRYPRKGDQPMVTKGPPGVSARVAELCRQ